jgi:hypothetical protein
MDQGQDRDRMNQGQNQNRDQKDIGRDKMGQQGGQKRPGQDQDIEDETEATEEDRVTQRTPSQGSDTGRKDR